MKSRSKDRIISGLLSEVESLAYHIPIAFLVFDYDTCRDTYRDITGRRFTNGLRYNVNRGSLLYCGFRSVIMAGTQAERDEVQGRCVKVWSKYMGMNTAPANAMAYFAANDQINAELMRLNILPRWNIPRPRTARYWRPSGAI